MNYAFIEFDDVAACTQAYFKMDGALVDDRRIKVDFSQSVSKLWNKARRKEAMPSLDDGGGGGKGGGGKGGGGKGGGKGGGGKGGGGLGGGGGKTGGGARAKAARAKAVAAQEAAATAAAP